MEACSEARLHRARICLEGLSVGDAFGVGFFMSFELAAQLMGIGQYGPPPYDFQDAFILRELIGKRRTDFRSRPWRWTDDTAQATEVVDNLARFQEIEPRALAMAFSNRYLADPRRGYGGAMRSLLPELWAGDWETLPRQLFGGTGSFGNGAAMRSAPIGAYFADSPERAARGAALSAQVTHSHPEGVAGSVAVALAACFASRGLTAPSSLISRVLPFVPDGEVKNGLQRAQSMLNASVEEAAQALGSGEEISAQDTVPFCLWCASRNLRSYEEALWETVAGLGDRDTTCAIVGGIVAANTGVEGIPPEWLSSREPLPNNE